MGKINLNKTGLQKQINQAIVEKAEKLAKKRLTLEERSKLTITPTKTGISLSGDEDVVAKFQKIIEAGGLN